MKQKRDNVYENGIEYEWREVESSDGTPFWAFVDIALSDKPASYFDVMLKLDDGSTIPYKPEPEAILFIQKLED